MLEILWFIDSKQTYFASIGKLYSFAFAVVVFRFVFVFWREMQYWCLNIWGYLLFSVSWYGIFGQNLIGNDIADHHSLHEPLINYSGNRVHIIILSVQITWTYLHNQTFTEYKLYWLNVCKPHFVFHILGNFLCTDNLMSHIVVNIFGSTPAPSDLMTNFWKKKSYCRKGEDLHVYNKYKTIYAAPLSSLIISGYLNIRKIY